MPSLDILQAGSAVAIRVGANIRSTRIKLGMTQSQLASPEFSISYISAIERGKIRPSLKALSLLALRLNLPLTSLLEGSTVSELSTRTVGYSTTSSPDQHIDANLLQADILIHQGDLQQAIDLLTQPNDKPITLEQSYRFSLLRGKAHLAAGRYQEAVIDLRAAFAHAESMKESEALERARNLLGKAHFSLGNYTLALENHLACLSAIEDEQIPDPLFKFDVLSNLAQTYSRYGNAQKAEELSRQALELHDEVMQDSNGLAQRYMAASQHYSADKKPMLARDYAMRSLALYKMKNAQRQGGLLHHSLGKTLEKQEVFDAAEQEYRKALAIEDQFDDDILASTSLTSLAELLLKQGKTQEAEKEAQNALSKAHAGNDPQTRAQALLILAQIRHQTGDNAAADQSFAQALSLLESSNAHELTASAYFRYANVLEERGEVQKSLNAIKKAYDFQQRNRGNFYELQNI